MAFSWVAPDGESNRHSSDNTTCLDPLTGERVNAMDRKMGVRERKWEMDSVIGTLKIGRQYFNHTGDVRPFDARWLEAVGTILTTLRAMQKPLTARNYTLAPYTFQKPSTEPKDTLAHGIGRPGRFTGMVRGGFLPSDDALMYPYHIPANAMAVVELHETAAMLRVIFADHPGAKDVATEAAALADEIDGGIKAHGTVPHPVSGATVLASQVDGYGNAFFGDDANIPSLLSLPYLGYLDVSDPLYKATRSYILSADTNPHFYGPGTTGISGMGSEDIGGDVGWGHVWHLGMMMQAFTSTDDAEVAGILADLARSSANGFMHESVWMDDLAVFSNPSFAWANSLLGELLLHLNATKPDLLFKSGVCDPKQSVLE